MLPLELIHIATREMGCQGRTVVKATMEEILVGLISFWAKVNEPTFQ